MFPHGPKHEFMDETFFAKIEKHMGVVLHLDVKRLVTVDKVSETYIHLSHNITQHCALALHGREPYK